MIRTVIIMSSSGLVLFIKQYVHSIRQPRMVGSLLIAMLEFSMVTAGMPVSYIELTGLGVTVVWNEAAKVFCALFLDREDGADFGRLLATEILAGFQDEYANELGSAALNLVDFSGFHSKLLDAIQRTAQPVLGRLVQAHGVLKAVLITESSQTFQTADIDQLGLLANLGALAGLSTDIMAHCGDSVRTLTLEGDARGNSRVLVWRVEQSTLVVAASRAVKPAHYQPAVDEAVDMLLRLARVLGSLR